MLSPSVNTVVAIIAISVRSQSYKFHQNNVGGMLHPAGDDHAMHVIASCRSEKIMVKWVGAAGCNMARFVPTILM